MLVLNANIRAFNSHVKSPKLHNSHFIAHTCICTFSSHQKNENTTQNYLSNFYFTSWYAYIQPTLSTFSLLINEGKKNMDFSIFSFQSASSFSVYMNKKRYDKIPNYFIFLGMSLPSCFGNKLWFKGEHGHLGLSAHPLHLVTLLWM